MDWLARICIVVAILALLIVFALITYSWIVAEQRDEDDLLP